MKSADAFPARRSLVVPFFSSRLPTLIFVFHLPMKAGNQNTNQGVASQALWTVLDTGNTAQLLLFIS